MNTPRLLTSSILALAASLAAAPAPAQDGTTATLPSAELSAPAVAVGPVHPFRSFNRAALYSGGVGLRNRLAGGIEISGIPPETHTRAAWLYWNIISDAPPSRAQRRILLGRASPSPSPQRSLLGQVVGQGASPCWGGARNTVLRAPVPEGLLSGNGTYLVSVPPRRFGRTDGALPWGNVAHPSINGASLFLVTEGSGEVLLYDAPMAGQMFSDALSYQPLLPPASASGHGAVLHFVNSDGQTGTGVTPMAPLTRETVSVNGALISGPGSPALPVSDWNGDEGGAYAQLWDNAVHDATGFVSPGATVIDVEVTAFGDCLVPVAVGLAREAGSVDVRAPADLR